MPHPQEEKDSFFLFLCPVQMSPLFLGPREPGPQAVPGKVEWEGTLKPSILLSTRPPSYLYMTPNYPQPSLPEHGDMKLAPSPDSPGVIWIWANCYRFLPIISKILSPLNLPSLVLLLPSVSYLFKWNLICHVLLFLADLLSWLDPSINSMLLDQAKCW